MREIDYLKPESITYAQFLSMKEKYRQFYIYNLEFIKDSDLLYPVKDWFGELDISSLTFGEVKELMENRDDASVLWKKVCEHYSEEDMLKAPAFKVLLTFRKLNEDIDDLIRYESELLASKVPGKYNSEVDSVDFTCFNNWFMQRDSLAGGDVTKYDSVDRLPYRTCFMKLLLDIKNNDVEKLIINKPVR